MARTVKWPIRAFLWYLRRPLAGYVIVLGLASYWGFMPRSGQSIFLDVFVLPWLLLLLVFLNLPLFGAALRRFRLPEEQRRNHALEHGTIFFLRHELGPNRRFGGHALPNGFRIWGANKDEIPPAFNSVVALEPANRWRVAVAKGCGSTTVFAQAVGVVLLLASIVIFALFSPSPLAVAVILATQLALALLLRYPLALALQRRLLLSVDFASARIHHIEHTKPTEPLEQAPAYIVHTQVR